MSGDGWDVAGWRIDPVRRSAKAVSVPARGGIAGVRTQFGASAGREMMTRNFVHRGRKMTAVCLAKCNFGMQAGDGADAPAETAAPSVIAMDEDGDVREIVSGTCVLLHGTPAQWESVGAGELALLEKDLMKYDFDGRGILVLRLK